MPAGRLGLPVGRETQAERQKGGAFPPATCDNGRVATWLYWLLLESRPSAIKNGPGVMSAGAGITPVQPLEAISVSLLPIPILQKSEYRSPIIGRPLYVTSQSRA